MRGADLVTLPMHCQCPWSQHLHTVHPDVTDPALRILRDHHWQRDIRTAVFWPAGYDRQGGQVDVIALENDLLARWLTTSHPWRKFPDLQESWQHRQFSHQALRHLEVQHLGDALADLIEIAHTERQTHPLH